jgi:hypothetical protein
MHKHTRRFTSCRTQILVKILNLSTSVPLYTHAMWIKTRFETMMILRCRWVAEITQSGSSHLVVAVEARDHAVGVLRICRGDRRW